MNGRGFSDHKPAKTVAGSFGGWRYDRFVSGLDDSVRSTIGEHLDHATSALERARSAMAAVLDGGCTRAAYCATGSVPRTTSG